MKSQLLNLRPLRRLFPLLQPLPAPGLHHCCRRHPRNRERDWRWSCSLVVGLAAYLNTLALNNAVSLCPLFNQEGGISRKHLVVLGGDPKPKQTGRLENFIRNKKPRPLFNHYANGSGWWDCNMEGVDGDEVGCNQAWEGVGSTTLGGLEWH
uniref:Uncharacterized protein n=1 Tax=Vitis vinifera TaxID=29760 RepID=A5BZZ0_VITVI|nr:hypothetical protein VITISV_008705 [Vitis vinifera]